LIPASKSLTRKQVEVLAKIREYIDQNGHPPNYPELAQLLNVRYSAARNIVHRMALKGAFEVSTRSPNRSYRLKAS
jgi:Mn-dependent DtxR family transcriptional regulator